MKTNTGCWNPRLIKTTKVQQHGNLLPTDPQSTSEVQLGRIFLAVLLLRGHLKSCRLLGSTQRQEQDTIFILGECYGNDCLCPSHIQQATIIHKWNQHRRTVRPYKALWRLNVILAPSSPGNRAIFVWLGGSPTALFTLPPQHMRIIKTFLSLAIIGEDLWMILGYGSTRLWTVGKLSSHLRLRRFLGSMQTYIHLYPLWLLSTRISKTPKDHWPLDGWKWIARALFSYCFRKPGAWLYSWLEVRSMVEGLAVHLMCIPPGIYTSFRSLRPNWSAVNSTNYTDSKLDKTPMWLIL